MTDRLGVVAVVPFWSQSDNLNTDSAYAYLRVVLPALVQRLPDVYWLVFFPDPTYGADRWVYRDDGLRSERIKFVSWPYDTAQRSSVLGFDPMRFKRIEETYAPSLYWLHQVESGVPIESGYNQSFNRSGHPALLAQHHYIIHKSLPYPIESQFARRWMQLGGTIAADRVVFNSEHCRRMARESFGELVHPSVLHAIDAKSVIIREGLVTGDEPIAPAAEPGSAPLVIYNHRFENYKQPDTTFGVLAPLRDRYGLRIWATQATGQKTARYPIDRFISAPRRQDYLQQIATPAVNTINSLHETFCIAILDSMIVGHLIVAPNALTFPELVPPGYPFLFQSTAEQAAMLERICSTWPDEYNRWREPLAEHARAHFRLDTYADAYARMLCDVERPFRLIERKPRTVEKMHDLVSRMEVGKSYSVGMIARRLNSDYQLGHQAYPPRRIVRELLGYDAIGLTWEDGPRLTRR